KLEICQALRAEAEGVLKTEDDWNTSAPFNKLILFDSVIRENVRCHTMFTKGMPKEVIHPEGLDLPDGTHLQRGAWVGVPIIGVHQDERFYPDSTTYDPYRFIKLRNKVTNKTTTDQGISTSELDAARPGTAYLGFGYGRHACPGRLFAVLMMKTLLAHLTVHYVVEATGPQPKTKVIGDTAMPPVSATMRVRKRKIVSS
ncbi:cytochrome P450, partial [Thozetella sp. PMI_491]